MRHVESPDPIQVLSDRNSPMDSLISRGGKLAMPALALVCGIVAFAHSPALAGGDGPVTSVPSVGTLGYAPPGLYPGFQGFGLGYHLGYGYGGDALGVGVDGGYPFYGGPGYPRCDPRLRRIGGINPFPHFAGPGFPTPEHPNLYGGAGT